MSDTHDHLVSLRSIHARLAEGRQHFDFQPPSFVSHVQEYANRPVRLRRYAKEVINARIMMLFSASRMTTQGLVHTYLLGVDSGSPYPILLAARVQLELLAVVGDVVQLIGENKGEHPDTFIERCERVDQALIKATFGTRSSIVREAYGKMETSRGQTMSDVDLDILSAKNILTRLKRLARTGLYPGCEADYERLCEYVHPNYGLNMLLVVASPLSEKLLRFSHEVKEPFERALQASTLPMLTAARLTLEAFDALEPPFGHGDMAYPASD